MKGIVFIVLISILFSCSNKTLTKKESISILLKKSNNLIIKKKYYKVIEMLSTKVNDYSGISGVDTLLYNLAYSYYKNEEYQSAIIKFRRFNDNFRKSSLRPRSQFYLAKSYSDRLPDPRKDQTITKMALRELNFFTELFPGDSLMPDVKNEIKKCRNNLAKNVMLIGDFYFSREDYAAAKMYYQDVLKQYVDTDLADNALVKAMQCFIKLKDFKNAKDLYGTIKNYKFDNKSKIQLSVVRSFLED